MTDEPPRKVARTLDVLIDGKPHDLDEPWAIAFPLDHDALIEVDVERHELPAGAVLVWTGRELHWYPASHPVRVHVRGAWVTQATPMTLQEGGTLLWSAFAKADKQIDEYWRREPDW